MVSGPRIIGPALPPAPLVPYSDSEDDDEIMVIPRLPSSVTPRKRCSRKLKEPLDTSFLRCNKRLQPARDGFRDEASAKEALEYPQVYEGCANVGASTAPYLDLATVQGIGAGFLKMRPEDVSAATLLDLDDADE